LISAVQDVVRAGNTLKQAIAAAGVPPADQEYFQTLLQTELARLEAFNCARYRLTIIGKSGSPRGGPRSVATAASLLLARRIRDS
jgi:hypothetical protein